MKLWKLGEKWLSLYLDSNLGTSSVSRVLHSERAASKAKWLLLLCKL